MEVEVTVEGESDLMDAVDALATHLPDEVKDLMEQLAKEGKDFMDSKTPVSSGHPESRDRPGYLKSRNQVEVDGLEFTLSNDADYAPYVNYGTRHMHAQPFFEPTVEYLTGEMETVLAQVLEA